MFFFFFQAEDGIRDLTVTGFQTCALPIYWSFKEFDWAKRPPLHPGQDDDQQRVKGRALRPVELLEAPVPERRDHEQQIGRASCRERVEISGVGVSLKKKKRSTEAASCGYT